MKKKLTVILLAVIVFVDSVTIASLLSWSNVPEPAKSILGWAGVFAVVLFFPIMFLVASDEAG